VIQATEIMKWILQQGDLLVGRVLVVDILSMQFREFQLRQHPDCDVCVHYRMIEPFKKNRYTCLRSRVNMNEYVISVRELDQALKNNEDIQLVDVRTVEKHQAFNIGGQLIPCDELNDRLNELDPNKKIVTYCTSGGRSMRALQILLAAGFTSVKSLDGGMTAWRDEHAT
jgi:sulfur-carrier protein adenylyltransferase/sulfurtransferase